MWRQDRSWRPLAFLGSEEARQATQQRADFLDEQVKWRGQRVILARHLPGMLRNREQRVAVLYRCSVMFASERDAMLDDGMGFGLPWKPVIERRVWEQLAVTLHAGGVVWEMG